MTETHDCGSEAAAYVLGALEPSEVESFRAHLAHCAVCRDEVEALAGVARALPMGAPQYPVPRSLRRRIRREVRRDARSRSRARWAIGAPTWLRPRVMLATLGTTAIAAAGVVTGLELTAGAATTLIQARVTGIDGSAQLRVAGGRGELIVRHLSPPGRGHVYEVWLQRGDAKPVPASVLFGVGEDGNADVGIPGDLHGVSKVMVTPEPLGGTTTPTNAAVIVAQLA